MLRRIFLLALPLLLTACAGVPLSTMARFARLSPETLLGTDPAQVAIAVNVDASIHDWTAAAPEFQVSVHPAEPGTFAPVDKSLPMMMIPSQPETMGLEPAGKGRQWLVYGLTPDSARELGGVQRYFRDIRSRPGPHKGGTLSLGIKQDALNRNYPQLRQSTMESWLRFSLKEGFFKVWSGKVGDLVPAKHS